LARHQPEALAEYCEPAWRHNFAFGAYERAGEEQSMSGMQVANAFLSGAIAFAFAMIAVCFFRFWRRSRTRLFGLFSGAFFLLAVERFVLVFSNPDNEFAFYVYSIRLAAFLVIIAAIVDQNRRKTR
jgi:hypothetical protein